MSDTEKPNVPAAAAPAAKIARTPDEIRSEGFIAAAAAKSGDAILDAKEFAGEITFIVDRDRIVEVCRAFKDDGFDYLVDLAGVDYSTYTAWKGERFGVAYTLYSFAKNQRVRLRVTTDIDTPIPSVHTVWKTANWQEREAFDMFGIVFSGHPNLERILTWDGFNGYPLRKDFPIRGIDTGARIYPEVFLAGTGPMAGSTGKDAKDMNIFKGEWTRYGQSPPALIPTPEEQKALLAAKEAKPAPKQ